MGYISLNIQMIFIFDGKPPNNKQDCINQRKEKSKKAKEASLTTESQEEKEKLEKSSLRLTKEMIDDVKKKTLLCTSFTLVGQRWVLLISYWLCRLYYTYGYYGISCPKLIRNCIDRSVKRNVVSLFDYNKLIDK